MNVDEQKRVGSGGLLFKVQKFLYGLSACHTGDSVTRRPSHREFAVRSQSKVKNQAPKVALRHTQAPSISMVVAS